MRRWRLASGRRKVVKLGRCRPVPRGARGAGGAPAPGNGATTPLREAGVRKHLAPEGALRLFMSTITDRVTLSQKAPSTRRCIKTISVIAFPSLSGVRKHPAPEGALRLNLVTRHDDPLSGQKAPSTRRCIKTHQASRCRSHPESQKAPSTRRCIKTIVMTISIRMMPPPESTSHQKMH